MQKKTLSLFWHFSKPYWIERTWAIILSACAVLTASFIAPLVLSQFMNQLQAGTVRLENSWGLIAAYFGIQIMGEIVFWRFCLYNTWVFEATAQRDIYTKMFTALSEQSLSFHANRFGGSLVSQSTKFNGAFERFWDTIIWQLVPVVTSIVAAVTILSFYFTAYAFFILCISVIFMTAVFFGSRLMAKRNKLEAQLSTKSVGYLADMVSNIATVKAFGNETYEQTIGSERAETLRKSSLHVMWGFLFASTGYSSLLAIMNTGALVFAVLANEQSLISIGTVYLAIVYSLTVGRQLWEMNSIMRNYNRFMGDAHDMVEILNLEQDIIDTSNKVLKPTKGEIKFNNVSFSHDNGAGVHVFNSFTLAIPAGQRIGLVGHSGSGKTTCTRILLRFSDIQEGSILIDGQNIAEVTQQSLRQSIAYVPQEPMLFHRSLRENIAYGKIDASDEEIIVAAKRANAWEFIEQLPSGLNTLVGERGVKLSGGQRQRIAIARAILKDAPILVLDEATSALDSESEKLIQEALSKLMKGRTSIVIAHRLSTIAKLDRIIVLDNGQIVEDGTHSELLEKNGIYAKLWSHQSGGFIEE